MQNFTEEEEREIARVAKSLDRCDVFNRYSYEDLYQIAALAAVKFKANPDKQNKDFVLYRAAVDELRLLDGRKGSHKYKGNLPPVDNDDFFLVGNYRQAIFEHCPEKKDYIADVETRDEARALLRIVSRRNPQRDFFIFYDHILEGVSQVELSRRYGLTPSSISQIVARIRQQLRGIAKSRKEIKRND